MTARVTFIGNGTLEQWHDASEEVYRRYGDGFTAIVYAEARVPADIKVVSRYELKASKSPLARDAEMLIGCDYAIAFDERSRKLADSYGVPWYAPTPATPTAPPTPHEFLWFDLETTGLNPGEGLPLEFAAVLCADARGDTFEIVQQFSGVIHHDADAINAAAPDQAIIRMHTNNGLWDAVHASTTTLLEVDRFLSQLAESLTGGRKRAVTLAGNSVHFDLAWCRVHLPLFAAYLSHRVFDVTTLRRAIESWAPAIEWPPRNAHRALADVHASIAEAQIARKAMGL